MWPAVVLAFFGAVAPASAQTITTGTLTGVVEDQQGGALPGATVTATQEATGTTYTAVTQNDGRYLILNVKIGTYVLKVSMSGFKEAEQKDVVVSLGEEKTTKFSMQLAVTETVTVTGETPLIDLSRAGTAGNVDSRVIEGLPTISRSVFDFARVSPYFNVGAAYSATDDTAVSVAGRNNRYNNMQIDGAVSNDVFGLSTTGTPGGQTGTQPISLDAIQEIQLVVSSYDVRQGGFTGGGINAVTKSGTNRFFGSGYYFGRNQSLIGQIPGVVTPANPDPADTKVGTFADKQGGASFGGPIKKNFAFFFGNIDYARKTTPSGFSADGSGGVRWGNQALAQQVSDIAKNTWGYDVGGLSIYSTPNNSDKYFGRVDFNLPHQNRLTYRTNYVDGISNVGTVNATSYLYPDRFYQIQDTNLSNVGQLNSSLKGGVNELRVYYQRERNVRGHRPEFEAFPAIQVDLPDGTNVNFGTEFSSQANKLNQDVVEITDDYTFLKGKHTFTVGSHNEFYKFYNLFIQGAYGSYRFSNMANFQAGIAQQYTHNFSNTSDPNEAARFSVRQFGLYAGDQWRMSSNLTITYGLRVDLSRFPDTPLANPLAVSDFGYHTDAVPSPTMWSPRIGFNWAPDSTFKNQVRGGIGMFTGRTPYVWLSNQYGNTGVQFTNLSTTFATGNQLPFSPDPNNQPTTAPGGTTGRQTINLIDPNYIFPEVIRGNIAYDRDLGFMGLIGSTELVFSKNVKDIYYQNINYIPASTQPDGRTVYKKFDANLNDVMLLTNTDQGSSWMLTFKVDRPFRNGVYITGSYSYGDSRSITDGTSSVARSNWTTTPIGVDTNAPALTRSNYSQGNRVSLSATVPVPLPKGIESWASFYYNGQNGKPYTLRFNGDANADGVTTNDIIFVPATADQVNVINGTWEQLDAFLKNDPAASQSRGQIMERNIGRAPWYNQLDLRYAVTVPTGGKTKVELTADVFNFLNLLNKDWGWQYYPRFPSATDVIGFGTPANGKLTYNLNTVTSQTFQGEFDRSDLRSRWQTQFGVRVRF
jgi:hypothetical protein